MKAKHSGIIAVTLAGLSGIGTLTLGGWMTIAPRLVMPGLRANVPPLTAPAVSAEDREAMSQLYPRLSELARPRGRSGGEVNYQMLGFSRSTISTYETTSLGPEERFASHVITMAYVSGENRFAVIDGRLYREGERLEGSTGTVRTITPNKVLIAGKEVRQWVEVFNPVAFVAPKPEESEAQAEQPVGGLPPRKETPGKEEEQGRAEETVEALKGFADALKQFTTLKKGLNNGDLGAQ